MQRIRAPFRSVAPLWRYYELPHRVITHLHPLKQTTPSPLPLLFSTVAQTPFPSNGKFAIQVGATLQLKFSQSDAELNISTSDNLEEIELKALWRCNMDSKFPFNLGMKNNHVCVALECDEKGAYLQKLGIVMPGRWCSLVLEGGKGDVMIEDMKEANAHVRTAGGNIRLGEMRANEAFLKSNGGTINARLISGILNLSTDGGGLFLKKAIGTKMQIDTAGGNIAVGSVYGGDIDLTSGGGCVAVKHIQAQGKAIVSTSGGHVKIDGLDGNAEIISNGGNIEVQLLQNANEIKIDAGMGDVTIYASSENDIHIENPKEWKCNQKGLSRHISTTGQGTHRTRVIISRASNVVMKERSWFNAVMGSTFCNSG